jgi:uncharacterized OB-fold protein
MSWPVHTPAPLPDGAKPRPGPPADLEQNPFWEAAAEGRLLVQRCGECGAAQLYGRAWCRRCHGAVGWVEASGLGRVHTFTVVRQHHSRSFRHLLPLVVALVDLDEGARLMTNLVGVDPEEVSVGLRVQVRFERTGDGAVLPLFEPTPDASPESGN